MMKVHEFERYIRKGLGRANILLCQQTDKTPYRRPLITFLTEPDQHYGRYFGVYEKELIYCFEDCDAIAAEVANSLIPQIGQGNRLITIPLLVLLGYKDAILEVVERLYTGSYAELVEFTKRGDSDEKYPPCAGKYFSAVAALGRCKVDSQRMKRILLDMANLYHYTDHPVVPEYQNPIFSAMDGMGKDVIFTLLDEISTEHRYGYKLDVRKELVEYPHKYLPNITAADILACESFGDKYARLYVSFTKADKSVVREVAERILNETDTKRQLHWLSFFTTAVSPDLQPPMFPIDLDPTPLVEIADQIKTDILQGTHPTRSTDADRYLEALCFIRHPSVKAFGKKILEDKESPKRLRIFALRMFYGSNYMPEDKDAFAALLLSKKSSEHTIAFDIFAHLIRLKTPEIPLDLIPYVFETFDSYQRYNLVEALIESDSMPSELKIECCLDADQRIRKLSLENMNKSVQ